MDFALRYDGWFRPLATVFGLGPKWTTIRVDDDTLHVRYGWAFRLDVPLKDIKSARLITERPMAWGVHTTGEYWYVNGSRDGIVELKLAHPATSKSVKFQAGTWGEVHRLYISLEDPDGFIAAMKSHPTD
ncbi:MAG: PH domain-containing protein [Mycobacterium sp.]